MIDEKELEYKTIPLGSYLSNPVSLVAGVIILIVALMVLSHVPDAAIPMLLLILGLGLLATFLYRYVESINVMKSKAIRAAYGNISESERKSAFLQKYYAGYLGTGYLGILTIGGRYSAYSDYLRHYPQREWTFHLEISNYRIFILKKGLIKIFEATTNDGKVAEKKISVSSGKEITEWNPKVKLIWKRGPVFTYKTKDGAEEKIFTQNSDFMDYEQFENAVRSLYGNLMAEQKTTL